MSKNPNSAFYWRTSIKWLLVAYDAFLMMIVSLFIIALFPSGAVRLSARHVILHTLLSMVCILSVRIFIGVYNQIWRYARTHAYLLLIHSDTVGGALYYLLQLVLPCRDITFIRALSYVALDLLAALSIRFLYQYAYDYATEHTLFVALLRKLAPILTGLSPEALQHSDPSQRENSRQIGIAIVGAGRVGVMLAEELLNNPHSAYTPLCFIDVDQGKVGRNVCGIPVYDEDGSALDLLNALSVQEVVFAIPDADASKKKELYERYKASGCKMKIYDFPTARSITNGKRHLREFDIEELLFRQVKDLTNPAARAYYRDKVILISGGGGSIGSELARQIAKMHPKQLILLDIYENCVYDIQQELRFAFGSSLDLAVEIVSVTDRPQLDRVFARYRPHIVLHAAAHKHVPLMEHNCCEAVANNVFGTLNIVEASEKYRVQKFTMISTDKAVNPTNVMGATKRMCEMIVQSRTGYTDFSATRFGNVLGSNGSVIPLFRHQIANGGPVTLTDKRIIRYFMTIPEASQLVLTSAAMAKNGELYVLDMGKPVKILELAENMIRLSGFEPYRDIDIIETGLRPGEKLYEELLIQSETLDKTDNSLIFVERDRPLSAEEIDAKLELLRRALSTNDNETVRQTLRCVVPTFRTPEEVNSRAERSAEMQNVREVAIVS